MADLIHPLILGAVVAVIVALFGAIVPPLFGRPRTVTPILDLVLLALLIAVLVFVLAKLGWAHVSFSM